MSVQSLDGFVGISLFSGAGGLDLGLEQTGVRFAAWVEIDKDSQDTLRANFAPRPGTILGDITAVDPADLFRAAGGRRRGVFVVAGGPPCQAFSTAGKRQSVRDPRGAIVDSYFHIVEKVRPRFFVFENVRGLLSAALTHRPLSERGNGHQPLQHEEQLGSLFRQHIRRRFEATGYEVVAGLVDSADHGVPQRRTRLIVLGSRDHEFLSQAFEEVRGRPVTLHDLMPPSHSAPPALARSRRIASARPSANRPPWRSLKWALSRLPPVEPEFIPYSKARYEVFKLIPPGRNWRYVRDNPDDFPSGFLAQIMGGALDSTGGRVGFWRRLSWFEPCPTLTTSPVQKATGLCHPDETRPLSVQEFGAIQGFPSSHVVCGGTHSKYRQLGNAVPVGLSRAIGDVLVRAANRKPWRAEECHPEPRRKASQLELPLGETPAPPPTLIPA